MSASLLVLPLSASLILPTSCLRVSAVVLIVAELVAVVEIYVAEVSPRVGVGSGEVVGVDLRHHVPNVCKVAILPLKVGLADFVVLWWKALQDDVLVLAIRGAPLGSDGI